ncbi:WbbJ Acetyltransferase [Pyrenophora tritici-repentis]|nr:WbbJ Acetyltransferase (isoleucine patch superfamily) [Pyrenophora tritici-repentis]KAI0592591.1 WbbJ Acetyltransferase (isoleucine patch superfamily) [Pyrenophora tritici-repentis]KAI0615735.1 WbbJ Acetyltransferase (isoleucine patch superfamily) [Pyrenophora tritici-repentis]KAI0622810.1 WbbJ Acetyltransferase (isoleucine patch superfamily) [Pyrenophora tritici-repentis]KAI2485381.1 WbbJ Acetyltransferase [Pyrenophora tritici-repentis]
MTTVLRMPAFNSAPHGPAFTSVNGPSSVSPTDEQKPDIVAVKSNTWSPPSRAVDTTYHSPSSTSPPTLASGDGSPDGSNKRRWSISENDHLVKVHSPDRQLPPPYPSAARAPLTSMEAPQQRSLPPLARPDPERRWQTEPRELPHAGHQHFEHREPRPADPIRNGIPPDAHGPIDSTTENDVDHSTEVTRAGVHVELKKRKRQFANRTKTGCGTCRRRKKKCDEAKPDCNNCTRGGFVCEGYNPKMPWNKNGQANKPPAIQAKERLSTYPTCPYCNRAHIPHCAARGTDVTYPAPEPHAANEHERKYVSNSWSELPAPPPPARSYHASEAPPQPAQYTRPSPNHHDMSQQQIQAQHQHNPRVYHHTPQNMGHVVTSATAPASIHISAPAPAPTLVANPIAQQPPPPERSPVHYPNQSSFLHKTEKAKMLAGEPFLPFDRSLMDERHNCLVAQQHFNATINGFNQFTKHTRDNLFRSIVRAGWIGKDASNIVSHLGSNVNVVAPFACDYGYHLNIGDDVVIGSDCHLHDSARICIGRNTKIGVRVTIQTLKTPTDNKSLKGSKGTEVAQEVHIGENVYIGDNCVIEAGVRIGENTIVRPGSVVSRDLPSNCVAQGNPAIILPN